MSDFNSSPASQDGLPNTNPSSRVAKNSQARITHAAKIRVENAIQGKSLPRPAEFSTKEHWASDWVERNGMTLPPDVPEMRSLRNYFCNQLNRWKKGETKPEYQEYLLSMGIDFSIYKAHNTGKGVMPDDQPFIEQLLAWKEEHGSFNLNNSAPQSLLFWQTRLLDRFFLDGTSKRMKDIQLKVPGLNYATWLRPDEPPLDQGWMEIASMFKAEAETAPAFRGNFNPKMSSQLIVWGKEQQQAASRKALNRRQIGVLKDLSILVNVAQREASKARQENLALARLNNGTSLAISYNERRLSTFLGTCLFVRKLLQGCDSVDIMTELCISPEALLRIEQAVRPELKTIIEDSMNIHHIKACRDVYLDAEAQAKTQNFFSFDVAMKLAPRSMSNKLLPLFEEVYLLWVALKAMNIEQDLPDLDRITAEAEESRTKQTRH